MNSDPMSMRCRFSVHKWSTWNEGVIHNYYWTTPERDGAPYKRKRAMHRKCVLCGMTDSRMVKVS